MGVFLDQNVDNGAPVATTTQLWQTAGRDHLRHGQLLAAVLVAAGLLLTGGHAFAGDRMAVRLTNASIHEVSAGGSSVDRHAGSQVNLYPNPLAVGGSESAPAVVITVSRAAESIESRVYSRRSRFSGRSAMVAFSTHSLPQAPIRLIGATGESLMPTIASLAAGMMPSRMPVAARSLSSGFGMREHPLLAGRRFHSGIDLAARYGSPIVATSDGMVGTADWRGGYGLFVALEHGGGIETRYGHMSQLNVVPGQQVRKGDVIGFVGSTGRSTGPHLHYEIRINGSAIDPASSLGRR